MSERIPRPGSRIDSAFIELITADRFDCIAGTKATPSVTAAVISRQAASTTASTRVSDKRTTVAGLSAISAAKSRCRDRHADDAASRGEHTGLD